MILVFIVAFIGILLVQNKVYAKSYSIEDMDIQATVKDNGTVSIEQTLTYKFDGSYNGIYMNVPYKFEDSEMKEVIKNGKISDAIYDGTMQVME